MHGKKSPECALAFWCVRHGGIFVCDMPVGKWFLLEIAGLADLSQTWRRQSANRAQKMAPETGAIGLKY
jgi:hypothetical protein